MSKDLFRPFSDEEMADHSRITCWNNFEYVCMRHRDFRKSPNQSESVMEPFYPIIKKMSKRYFRMFDAVFSTTGYDYEDLESYGRVYLINFLGNPRNERPQEEQFKLFTSYIKQRYGELASICNRKNKNILGCNDRVGLFEPIEGEQSNYNVPNECLYDNPGMFGFRRINKQDFLIKVKNLGGGKRARQKVLEGLLKISLGPRELNIHDVENTELDLRDNLHIMNPEEYLQKKEEGLLEESTGLKKILDEMPPDERMKFLTKAFKYIRKKDMRDALRTLIKSYKEVHCG